MGIIFDSIYARACMGAGLAVLTGLRAFFPIAFLALYSHLEFASAPSLKGTPFAFFEQVWLISLLFALAVIELALDKIFAASTRAGRILQPFKAVLGGVVFAAAMAPEGWIAMTVAGVLGLVIAVLADHVRRSTQMGTRTDKSALILISIYEDLVVLAGTLLFVLVPLIGALLTCFLVLFAYRLQVVRKRKHRGLRILRG